LIVSLNRVVCLKDTSNSKNFKLFFGLHFLAGARVLLCPLVDAVLELCSESVVGHVAVLDAKVSLAHVSVV